MRKIFKNISKNGKTYYTTSFYNKGQDGTAIQKNIFVSFQNGTLPMDANQYDFYLKGYVNGEEYDVVLDCYNNNGNPEGRLFFGKFNKTEQTYVKPNGEEVPVKEYESEKAEQLVLNSDSLPFY